MTTPADPMPIDEALAIVKRVAAAGHAIQRDIDQIMAQPVHAADPVAVGLCPFCGGRGVMSCALRDGYQNFRDDPDAFAYWVECVSCAAHGPWEKSVSAALRRWRTRVIVTDDVSVTKDLER